MLQLQLQSAALTVSPDDKVVIFTSTSASETGKHQPRGYYGHNYGGQRRPSPGRKLGLWLVRARVTGEHSDTSLVNREGHQPQMIRSNLCYSIFGCTEQLSWYIYTALHITHCHMSLYNIELDIIILIYSLFPDLSYEGSARTVFPWYILRALYEPCSSGKS